MSKNLIGKYKNYLHGFKNKKNGKNK